MTFTDLLPLIPFLLAIAVLLLVLYLLCDALLGIYLAHGKLGAEIERLRGRLERLEYKLRELPDSALKR